MRWTDDLVKQAIVACSESSKLREAYDRWQIATGGAEATLDAFQRKLRSESTNGSAEEFLRPKPAEVAVVASEPKHVASKTLSGRFGSIDDLVKLTRKSPISFETLCDRLNSPPSKVRALISEAKERGIKLHVENDHVGVQSDTSTERAQSVGVPPTVGKRFKLGVISDLHAGSKYCLAEQIRDFVHYAYEQGVREIVVPGDLLDGFLKHSPFEVVNLSIDGQAQDLCDALPALPGLNYRAICGNHDFSHQEKIGVDVGGYLEMFFRARGRNDLHFYGDRSAMLQIGGIKIHLWHPKKGMGYAKSYAIQKQIEKYSSGEKPHLLLIGHWHVYATVYERGVHGIACPCFQGGGSAFAKSLGGAPAIGGLILSWCLTEHGTMRSYRHEMRAYFEQERPHQLDGDDDGRGIPIPSTTPQAHQPRAAA